MLPGLALVLAGDIYRMVRHPFPTVLDRRLCLMPHCYGTGPGPSSFRSEPVAIPRSTDG